MTKRNGKRASHHNASQGGSASRGVDTYQLVTDRIIEQLEKGVVPWRQPWSGGWMPQNLVSGHVYRGVNTFLLGCCAPYSSPFWVTYRQAEKAGGHVKAGERGWPVVYWCWQEREKADGKKETYAFCRYYTVFNAAAQCEGLEAELPEVCEPDPQWDPIEAAEEIVAGFARGPEIDRDGNRAAYKPASDAVVVPAAHLFTDPGEYYSTLFHELGHATGHSSRLARNGVTDPIRFHSHAYSKEELVAEMTSAFLCGEAGILHTTIENSAAYIGSWLKQLKDDKRMVVQAAAQAQKAADLILGDEMASEEEVSRAA